MVQPVTYTIPAGCEEPYNSRASPPTNAVRARRCCCALTSPCLGPLRRPAASVDGADDRSGDIDAATRLGARLVVVGADADLATVLTRLLRAERLDVEVGYAPRRRTPPPGFTGCRRAAGRPGGRGAGRRGECR